MNITSSTVAYGHDADLRTAVRVEELTLIWMIIEGLVSVGAGLVAGSLLLIAFGIDSVIELVSAFVLFRRLKKESSGDVDLNKPKGSSGKRRASPAGCFICWRFMSWCKEVSVSG